MVQICSDPMNLTVLLSDSRVGRGSRREEACTSRRPERLEVILGPDVQRGLSLGYIVPSHQAVTVLDGPFGTIG